MQGYEDLTYLRLALDAGQGVAPSRFGAAAPE